MILNEPDYQKAIDAIDQFRHGSNVSGHLDKDLTFMRAGLKAEEQMAYQLKSYFQSSTELFVWNNLKLTHGDINAQIDHLVFSRRAFWIIESKSISDTVTVNEHGEFHQIYRGKPSGIKSPIEQVKRQQQVFLEFMRANREEFLGTLLSMQKGLGSWTPFVFVAISEKGKIEGRGRRDFVELCKFDQIARRINDEHKKTDLGLVGGFLNTKPELMNIFSKNEMEKFQAFLKRVNIAEEPYEGVMRRLDEKHIASKPEEKKTAPAKQAAAKADSDEFTCGKCGSKNMAVAFGRSYYFKCKDCDGNTPIHLVCPQCKAVMKTRKQKNEFFKCCEKCGTSERYFVNKEA